MGQEYDILIDINNVIVILILIGIPMWVWGAWSKKRNPANARAPWIARIGHDRGSSLDDRRPPDWPVGDCPLDDRKGAVGNTTPNAYPLTRRHVSRAFLAGATVKVSPSPANSKKRFASTPTWFGRRCPCLW